MKRRDFLKATGTVAGMGLIGSFPGLASARGSMKFDSYVTESAGPSWIDRWFLDELEKA